MLPEILRASNDVSSLDRFGYFNFLLAGFNPRNNQSLSGLMKTSIFHERPPPTELAKRNIFTPKKS